MECCGRWKRGHGKLRDMMKAFKNSEPSSRIVEGPLWQLGMSIIREKKQIGHRDGKIIRKTRASGWNLAS